MANPLFALLDLVRFLLFTTIEFVAEVLLKVIAVFDAFGSIIGIGGLPVAILAIAVMGIISYYFGYFVIGSAKTVIILFMLGMAIALIIVMLL
ncbi:MAG: hypothetical protein HYX24_03900 [Candidatus Aenigmarchaeota archaeon]|nr:hypothetical protein [Candidatus Aenigmarchaeota archaeon]